MNGFMAEHNTLFSQADPWAETKFEVGDGPYIRPPNIWRSGLVLRDVQEKHKVTKKR